MSQPGDELRAVEFRTVPLTNREANKLHDALGAHPDVANAYLSGDDSEAWEGAVLPADPSDLMLLETIERLKEDARIVAASVVVGRFPER